ncbi:unnamed protein product, partial [Adineta steineri]
ASINANRYRSELENMIGMFVSTLPYCVQLNSHWSFDEVVKYVKEKCLSILEHSHYPLQHILTDFRLNQMDVPFLDIVFNFLPVSTDIDRYSIDDVCLEKVSIEQTDEISQILQTPMILTLEADKRNNSSAFTLDSVETTPASFAQARIWLDERIRFDPDKPQIAIYNMPFVYRLQSHHTLSINQLRHALHLTVNKHPSLHTSLYFDIEKNLLMQRIVTHEDKNKNNNIFSIIETTYETDEQLNDILHDEKRNPLVFNHAQGLVFRCHIIYYKQISSNHLLSNKDVLIFNFHHALFDFPSMQVFHHDLNQAYTTGQLLYDDNTNLRYLDYAVIEQQMSMSGASMFWLDALHDCKLDQSLSLPFDRYRLSNEHRTGRGTSVSFDFGQYLSHDFLTYASSNNISLEHLALATYYVFLFKLTNGQTDLCLAMNINNNRYRDELKSIIGLFENVIPLRCQLDSHSCFHQLLERVREITTNSMKYSYFPLQRILDQHPQISKHAFLDTSLEFISYKSKNDNNVIMIGDSQVVPGFLPFNSIEHVVVIGIMGIEMAGGVYCPLSPRDPQHRLYALTLQTQSRNVLVHWLTKMKFNNDSLTIDIDSVLINNDVMSDVYHDGLSGIRVTPKNIAYIIFTSGSTGIPKAVQVRHENFTRYIYSFVSVSTLKKDDVTVQMARSSFDVHFQEIAGVLLIGATLVMLHPRGIMDFDYLVNVMVEKSITYFASVPSIINGFFTFLQQQNYHNVTQYLRLVCSGGEPCSIKLINLMSNTLTHTCRILNMYGTAETTIDCTFHFFNNTMETESIPIGRPLSNYQNLILDQFSQKVFIDREGELFVGGVGVFVGYLGRDDLTAKALIEIDGELFYRTGDLVTIDNNGLLHYQGRKDHQIKLHGQRIELGEIERCLLSITSISACIVMKWNDDYLVAYVQSSLANEEELRQHCQSHLPPHMTPSLFVILEKLPLNPNGKVDRKLLPSPHFSSIHLTNSIKLMLPTNDIEISIHRIWCEILKQNQISTDTNIFTIGGHSLLMMQLFHQYKIEFHLEQKQNTLSISNLFQYPTIIQHAQLIQQSINTIHTVDDYPWSSLHLIQAKASFAQERIYLDEQIRFSSNKTTMNNMYAIPLLYRITSMNDHVSITRLHHAFQNVITRHNILRTALYIDDTNNNITQQCLDINIIRDGDIESNAFTIVNIHNDDRHYMNETIEKILNQADLFDLSKGHVIRCHILRHCGYLQDNISCENDDLLSENDHILISIHHAMFDGASTSIFLGDLSLAYQSNDSLSVVDNRLNYIDYSVHEHIMDMSLSQEFWHSQLERYNIECSLSLPFDRERSSTNQQRSGLASIAEISFDNELCTSFIKYASSHHLTYFQLGLSLFYVFLFKLTHGETDLCIGSINANRYRNELQNLIGMFVSTLPYRLEIDSDWSFDKLVQHVREKCLSILEHSHYPLQHILGDNRSNESSVSFLEIIFDFITVSKDIEHLCLNDASLEQMVLEQSAEVSKFDFSLTVEYNPLLDNKRLSCNFVCSRDLFEKSTISQIAQRFQYMFEQLFQSKSSNISVIDMSSSINKLSLILPEEAEEMQLVVFHRLDNIADEAPASFAQARIWLDERIRFDPDKPQIAIYNMPFVYRLQSHHTLSINQLRHALHLTVNKHPSLHTSLYFDIEKNLLMQRIVTHEDKNKNNNIFSIIETTYETDEQLNDILHDEKRNPLVFNHAQGLVFRCHIIYYKQISSNHLLSNKDVLIFNFHHALFDFPSMQVFHHDLNQAYTTGQLLYDDNTNLRYLDYAVIEQQMSMSGASMFWLDALHDCKLDQSLSLPFDRYRLSNEHRTGRGTSVSFDFGQYLSHDFLTYASSNNISLEHLALATYYVFLFKLTNGQTDLCLAMNINNNRYRDELKSIIGLFENVIPLRCQLDSHSCFHQLLERVREITTNSMKYSYFPLQRILDQHPQISKHAFLDTSLEFISYKSKNDNNVIMIGDSQVVPGFLPFNSIEHVVVMNKPIHELSLILSNEQYLMQSLNNTQVSFSSPRTCIHHEFVHQVMKHPQKLAVELDEQSLTYCEILYYVQILSLTLLNEHHVVPGEIVCQCVERSLSMVIGIMGIEMAGGVYCPLSPRDPQHRLHALTQQTQSRLVLVHHLTNIKFDHHVVSLDINSILINNDVMSNVYVDRLSRIIVTLNDIAYVIFTSGSTGIPKAVQVRHENFTRYMYSFVSVSTLKNDDVTVQMSRSTFDVHVQQIVGVLLIGATLVMLHAKGMADFDYLADVLYKKQITYLNTVPVLFQSFFSFLSQCKKTYVVKYLRSLCSGGDAFASKLISLTQKSNIPNYTLWNLYGPAETTITSTFHLVDIKASTKCVPIGRPLSHYRCMIMNEYLQSSVSSQEGELFVGGVGVFAGYLGRDDLTAKALVEIDTQLFYRTGDLVRIDSNGLLHYQGRKDHQIKLHGQRIELGEIERCLLNITSISACVVIKWNDDYLVAYVQSSNINEQELREHCQSHLPPHMIPSIFVILDKLPLNQNGKIDRKQLPSPDFSSSTLLSSDTADTPLNQFEQRIHTIWCQVLHSNKDHMSRTTSFFSIGGHSLLFIELYHHYQSVFNFDAHTLSIAPFLQQPTIFQHSQLLQTVIMNNIKATQWYTLHINEGIASFAQERIFLDEQVRFSSDIAVYNELYTLQVVQGSLPISRLLQAFQYVLNKHKILRTSLVFNNDNSSLKQRIIDINKTFTITMNRTFENESELQDIIYQTTINPTLFDLSTGHVFHAEILRHQISLNENRNSGNEFIMNSDVLLIGFHHAAFDRASSSIFFNDLCLAYNTNATSIGDDDESLQYIDYSIHERLIDMTTSRDFWYLQLEGYNLESRLSLPIDRQRVSNEHRSNSASVIQISFDNEISQPFFDYASIHHVTPFQLGLSILYAFLFKLTHGKNDLCISCLNANRHKTELQNIMGMFVSTLPYRVQLDPQWSFDDLVIYVREKCLSILEHSHYPLQHILANLHINQSNISFLEAMYDFITVSSHNDELSLEGASFKQVSFERSLEVAKFDFMLTFIFDPLLENNRLSFRLTCSHDLFDGSTVRNIGRRLEYCFQQLFSSNQTINQIDTCFTSVSKFNLILPEETGEIENIMFCRQSHIMNEAPASFAQARIWLDERIRFDPDKPQIAIYNMPFVYHLQPGHTLSIQQLRHALHLTVNKHPSLHTSLYFDIEKNLLMQRVITYEDKNNSNNMYSSIETTYETDEQLNEILHDERRNPHLFDLAHGLVFRCHIIYYKQISSNHLLSEKDIIIFNFHHALFDFPSMEVFHHDLNQAYTTGQLLYDDSTNLRYLDYTVIEQQMSMTGASMFWLDALHDCKLDQPLSLPFDRYRLSNEHRTGRGTSISFDFGQDLSHDFLIYASLNNISLEQLALATYYVVLFQLTNGEKDLCIGINTLGRYRDELSSIIGMFVNAIPLRCQLDPHLSFHKLTKHVQDNMINCIKYSYFPLQRILNQHPNISNPVFLDTSFDFVSSITKDEENEIMIGDSRLSLLPFSIKISEDEIMSKFDFILSFQHDLNLNEISCTINASVDLFNAETICTITQRLRTMLHQQFTPFHSQINKPIHEVQLALPTEQLLLQSLNNTQIPFSSPFTCIHHEFVNQVMKHPQKLAVELDEQSLTYSELLYYVQVLSLPLLNEYDVFPGEIVCQCVERSLSMVIGIMAIEMASGIYCPLSPQDPQHRLYALTQQTQSHLVLVHHLTKTKFDAEIISLDIDSILVINDLNNDMDYNCLSSVIMKGEEIAYTLFTSGSTGIPKAVQLRQQNFINSILALVYIDTLHENDIVIQIASATFDAHVQETVGSLICGATLVMLHPQGESVSSAFVEVLIQFVVQSCRVWNFYGPAEATLGTTYHLINVTSHMHALPIGKPLPHYICLLLNNFLQPVMIQEEGELIVGGLGVFAGYLGRDDLTAKALLEIDGQLFYRTGDLVRMDNNCLLHYQGRKDHQIKLHGQRIELGEIERCLLNITSISACVVMKWNDDHLVAYVQSSDTNEEELHEHCQSHLPPHMVPSVFIILDKLPLNQNGKVDRKQLPSPDFSSSTLLSSDKSDTPLNQFEERILTIWCQVLHCNENHISRTNSFFSVGGHSLLFIELYHHYQSVFNFDAHSLSIAPFLQQPTISQHSQLLQTVIMNNVKATQWYTLNINEGTASFAQERIFLDEKVRFSSDIAIYNEVSTLQIVQGSLSLTRLLQALRYVLNKHKILRTSLLFNNDNSSLKQCITDIHKTFTIAMDQTFGNDNELRDIIYQTTINPNLFDLSTGHVFHAEILEHQTSFNENENNSKEFITNSDVLLIAFHHVASDRASFPIFFNDLCFAYNTNAISIKDDDESLQYIDYSIHERLIDMTTSRAFWYSQLEEYNLEAQLLLPVDRHRLSNDHRSSSACVTQISFDNEIAQSFLDYASIHHVTPFQLGLTMLYAFLFKLTHGENDICISCLNANRHKTELQNIMGMFVSILPYRIQLDPHWSFDDLVKYVQEKCLSILEHSHYPLQYILANLHINQSSISFLETVYDFITISSQSDELSLDGTRFKQVSFEQSFEVAKFDFMLMFVYNPTLENNRLSFHLTCSHDLFDEITVRNIGRRLEYCFLQLFSFNQTITRIDTCVTSISKINLILREETQEMEDTMFCRQSHIMNEAPASYAQALLYHNESIHFAPHISQVPVYNMPFPYHLHLHHTLSIQHLRHALQLIVRKHESLRTSLLFDTEKNIAIQRIIDMNDNSTQLFIFTESTYETQEQLNGILSDEKYSPHHFDLAQGLVFRCHIVYYKQISSNNILSDKDIIIFNFHHACFDYPSINIFLHDLDQAYKIGQLTTDDATTVSYIDYAVIEQQMSMTGASMFWLDTLYDYHLDQSLSLPYDRYRLMNEHRTDQATSISFDFGQDLSHHLLLYASSNNIKHEHLALAIYFIFLFKLTNGEKDLCIAMNTNNRYRDELKSIIGVFENIIPLRCQLDSHCSFHYLLEYVREITTNSMKYSYFSLQRILNQYPNVSKPAFLDISFEFISSMASSDNKLIMIGDGQLSSIPFTMNTNDNETRNKFDFSLLIQHDLNINQLSCTITASLDLFNVETIHKISQRFHSILKQLFMPVNDQMNKSIYEISLTLPNERLLMQSMNNTQVSFPSPVTCIHHEFVYQVMKHPQKLAVELDEQSLTYSELLHYVQVLSLHLINKFVVIPGEIICQCVERSLSMVIGIIAIEMVGGVYCPLSPRDPQHRLHTLVEQTQSRLVLVHWLTKNKLNDTIISFDVSSILTNNDVTSHIDVGRLSNAIATIDDLAYTIFTSGSTGIPKAVQVTHKNFVKCMHSLVRIDTFNENDTCIQMARCSFDIHVQEILGIMINGATLVMLHPGGTIDFYYLSGVLQNKNVTYMHAVPSLLYSFFGFVEQNYNMAALKYLRSLCSIGE